MRENHAGRTELISDARLRELSRGGWLLRFLEEFPAIRCSRRTRLPDGPGRRRSGTELNPA